MITKKLCAAFAVMFALAISSFAQNAPDNQAARDAEVVKKAAGWVAKLKLTDNDKAARVSDVIVTHLKAVRDWNDSNPSSLVPAGINPYTGNKLSEMDRQIIVNSAKPASVHENLMSGLRKDLSEEQVEAILDEYTIGKVAFTLKGYHAIVPDLKPEEEKVILGYLKQAREQAVDFKSMKQISAIFEIYKTKCEQYLNSNGRNWRALFKAYVDGVNAKKAQDKAAAQKK